MMNEQRYRQSHPRVLHPMNEDVVVARLQEKPSLWILRYHADREAGVEIHTNEKFCASPRAERVPLIAFRVSVIASSTRSGRYDELLELEVPSVGPHLGIFKRVEFTPFKKYPLLQEMLKETLTLSVLIETGLTEQRVRTLWQGQKIRTPIRGAVST
jgi:hypothetical protein